MARGRSTRLALASLTALGAAVALAAACTTFATATAAGPDAGNTFCASEAGHTFCEDFDQGNLASRGWKPAEIETGDGSVALDPEHDSPPNGLRVQLDALGAGGQATIDHYLSDAPIAKVTVSFSFRVDALALTDGGPTAVYLLNVSDKDDTFQILLSVNAEGPFVTYATVAEKRTNPNSFVAHGAETAVRFAFGEWHRFRLSIDFAQSQGALVIDDEPITLDAPFTTPPSLSGLILQLGQYTNFAGAGAFLYDNVTLDAE